MLTYSDIKKRKILKESDKYDSKNADLYASRLKENYKLNYDKLIRECSLSTEAANKYIGTLISVAESNNYSLDKIIDSVVPMVTESSIVTENTKITEALKMNNKCDMILDNHSKLQKIVNLEEFFRDNRKEDTTLLADTVASIVNRLKLPTRGKAQVSLQEFYYLASMYGINYDSKVITEEIVDVISATNNDADLPTIDKTIANNGVIDTTTAEPDDAPFKTPEDLDNYFRQYMSSDMRKSIDHFENLFYKIKAGAYGNVFDDKYVEALNTIFTKLGELFSEAISNRDLDASDIKKVIAKLDIAIIKQEFMANNKAVNPDICANFVKLLDMTRRLRDTLADIVTTSYSHSNISVMEASLEGIKKVSKKVFKRENLLHAIAVADRRLGEHTKDWNTKAANKCTKIRNWVFDNDSDVLEAVDMETGAIDYVVESYYFENGVDDEVKEGADDICSNVNVTDLYNTDYRMYYVASENVLEYHIKGDTVIEETDDYFLGESVSYYINSLLTLAESFENLRMPDSGDIASFISDYPQYTNSIIELCGYSGIDRETIDDILIFAEDGSVDKEVLRKYDTYVSPNTECQLEALHMLSDMVFFEDTEDVGDYDLGDWSDDDFLDDEEYLEEKQMVKITKHPDPNKQVKPDQNNDNKANVQAKLDKAQQIKDKANDKGADFKSAGTDDSTDNEGEKKKGLNINLNSVVLALHGFKKKIKDLSAKEQQASRNADIAFERFVNSVKKMFVSDRRESIIKGSVIPSFSQCIKLAIPLAIITPVNPVYAIIGLMGAIGVSKALTKKERALLLDEIETELEVIEKEIQIAESKNQMKKLRALLKTKKDLQRQYQRIKYNIRIGKDLVPSSTGTPSNN